MYDITKEARSKEFRDMLELAAMADKCGLAHLAQEHRRDAMTLRNRAELFAEHWEDEPFDRKGGTS